MLQRGIPRLDVLQGLNATTQKYHVATWYLLTAGRSRTSFHWKRRFGAPRHTCDSAHPMRRMSPTCKKLTRRDLFTRRRPHNDSTADNHAIEPCRRRCGSFDTGPQSQYVRAWMRSSRWLVTASMARDQWGSSPVASTMSTVAARSDNNKWHGAALDRDSNALALSRVCRYMITTLSSVHPPN